MGQTSMSGRVCAELHTIISWEKEFILITRKSSSKKLLMRDFLGKWVSGLLGSDDRLLTVISSPFPAQDLKIDLLKICLERNQRRESGAETRNTFVMGSKKLMCLYIICK